MKILNYFYLFWCCAFVGISRSSNDTDCPIVFTPNEDRRENKTSLRLVQYNVEWLFIDYYNGSDCPGNGCTWKNESEAQTHLGYVCNTISYLSPDILNLCEIEGCDEINYLIDCLNDYSYNGYLLKGTDTGTGQNVGMISRIDPSRNLYRSDTKLSYPISGSTCGYTGTPSTTGVSKHYITEYIVNNINIAFIAAHLIAIPTDPIRCAQREGQAQILQNIIYGYVENGYEVIMIGDMNDFDMEVPDLNSNKPLSSVLDILKGYAGEKKGKYELTSVAVQLNQTSRYSDWYDSDNNCKTESQKDFSMIDHILVSQNIRTKIENVYIFHAYSEYCGKYNSDHFPVIVDFAF